MRVSVVLSTYEAPDWLEWSLRGYAHQSFKDFQILVADDGSGDETRERIDRVRKATGLSIEHVWHEDDGFRKSRILNEALRVADADYVLFSDGDCIPRADFLAVHAEHAEPGRFLSGGYFKLTMPVSRAVTAEAIEQGQVFDPRWLRARGQPFLDRRFLKLAARPPWAALLDFMTPTGATWNGHNASGWRSDVLAVNGFDERMAYGGQDRELGERLVNSGVSGKQIRHRAVCVHLEHGRGYASRKSIERNRGIRAETRRSRSIWTPHGIVKEQQPVG